jgi:signal transduction histidine kinase
MSVPRDERTRATDDFPARSPRVLDHDAAGNVPSGASSRAPLMALRQLAARASWLKQPWRPLTAGEPFAATRWRLVAANVIAVAIVLAVLGVVVYQLNVRAALQEVDVQLAHYANYTATAVDEDQLPSAPDQGAPDRIVPYSPASSDLFTVVLDPSGQTLLDGDHIQRLGVPVVAAARPVLDGSQPAAITTVHAAGHDFRLQAVATMHEGKLAAVVVAGVSLDVQMQEEQDLLRALALIFTVVLLLTLLTSLFFTERALRPARQAFARQRQFAAAASHELRTPLAVIRSEAELATSLLGESLDTLRHGIADPGATVAAQLEESLGETRAITAEVDYMTRMANELLLLARDAADIRAHEWRGVDLCAVLRSTAEKIRPLAAREGLRLEMAGADAATQAWVRGDPDLLRQLFYGLLDNAVRYTPRGGSIRVAVNTARHGRVLPEHHRHVTLKISDTGVGIAPEHLAHIFEPFYRAVSARPRREQQAGTGLGLALAHWIVRAHGGTIAAHSTVGEGTTFIIELPRAQRGRAARSSRMPAPTPGDSVE